MLLSCTTPRNKRSPCPRPKLMIQTQQQAIKPNKTSTRQNLKRVRHPWLHTKNQISTLRINSDWHFDMPLVEPNSQSTRHYFSQTQKSCLIPPIWTIIFNQSQGRSATFAEIRRTGKHPTKDEDIDANDLIPNENLRQAIYHYRRFHLYLHAWVNIKTKKEEIVL